MMLCVVALLFVFSSSHTDASRPGCCTYDQWEGNFEISGFGETAGVGEEDGVGKRRAYLQDGVAHYDYLNWQTAYVMRISTKRKQENLLILTKYDEGRVPGIQYNFDLDKGTCDAVLLDYPFIRICTPASSKSMGQTYLGLNGQFKVDRFRAVGDVFTVDMYVQGLGQEDRCLEVYSRRDGIKDNLMITSVLFNVTEGIANRTIFDVPPACKKSVYTKGVTSKPSFQWTGWPTVF